MAFRTGLIVSVEAQDQPYASYAQTLNWHLCTTAGDELFQEHLRYRRAVLPAPGVLVHFQAWATAGGAAGNVQAFSGVCCMCHWPIAQIGPYEWVDAANNLASDVRCFWHSHDPEIPTVNQPYGALRQYRVTERAIRVLPGRVYPRDEIVRLNPEMPAVAGLIAARLLAEIV